jgi:hypothetical protein
MNRAWKRVLAGWTFSLAVIPLAQAAEPVMPLARSGSTPVTTQPSNQVAVVNRAPIARLGTPVVSLGEPEILPDEPATARAPAPLQFDPAVTPASGLLNWFGQDQSKPLATSKPIGTEPPMAGTTPMPMPMGTAPMPKPLYPMGTAAQPKAGTPAATRQTLPNEIIDPMQPRTTVIDQPKTGTRLFSGGTTGGGMFNTTTRAGQPRPIQPGEIVSGPTIVDGPVISTPLTSGATVPGNISSLPAGTVIDENGAVIVGADPSASWWTRTKAKLIGGEACGPECMGEEKHNLYRNRFFGSLEYIAWGLQGDSLPPLAIQGPWDPATNSFVSPTVISPSTMNNDVLSGARGQIGMWFTADQGIGMDTSLFGVEQNTSTDIFQSYNSPALGRPFFAAPTGAEAAQLVSAPDLLGGSLKIQEITQFYGGDLNLRYGVIRGQYWTLDLLTGFKYLSLRDRLSIEENLYVYSNDASRFPAGTAGSGITVLDQFSTQNNFYGGQIGGVLGLHVNRWSFDTTLKLAAGTNQVHANILGNTTVYGANGAVTNYTGGLLGQQSNIGIFNFSETSFVPELGFSVGYNFNPNVKMMVGYNLIYWTNVARAGNLIDTNVNPAQLPPSSINAGPPYPQFNTTDFWAQGISLGLELKY